jgi:cytochrome c oxidase subunit II
MLSQEGDPTMNQFSLAIAALLLLVLTSLNAVVQEAPKNEPVPSDVHEIRMTAKKYEFSPNPVHVKKGEHVRLVITATDRDHGIKSDAFHIDQKLKKGEPTPIEFTADKAGTFPFKCSVVCGFGHGRMKGTLVVDE